MKSMAGLISANYGINTFGKLTNKRPVAVLPFGSRYRLIDFPFSNIINSGIIAVGFITPHWYRSIMDHVGGGKDYGLTRKIGGLFILPGSTYGFDLGKGKFSIKDFKSNKIFFDRTDFDRVVISGCNKIFNVDYRDVEKLHIKNEANITLLYKKMEKSSPSDYIIDFDKNGKVRHIRKSEKIEKDVCVYLDSLIADKNVMVKFIDWYRDNAYLDIVDVINETLERIHVETYEVTSYAKSINNLSDYMEASLELLDEKAFKDLFLNRERPIHTKVHDAAPVKYTDKAEVTKSLVGTGSIISGELNDSIVFRDCVVEEGAKVKNSIVYEKCKIEKGAVLEYCIVEKGVVVGAKEIHKGTKEKPVVVI